MKSPLPKIKPLDSTLPSSLPSADRREQQIDQPVFLNALRKAAGFTRKDLQFEMRVNKTTVDKWMSGQMDDPIERARKVCKMFRDKRRTDLVATILMYVAGGYEFDGAVLSAAQVEALRVLSKAVNDP